MLNSETENCSYRRFDKGMMGRPNKAGESSKDTGEHGESQKLDLCRYYFIEHFHTSFPVNITVILVSLPFIFSS
ncbi:MAG: hypothetical protein Q4C37_03270 [Bacteroidales bacterium]|nr:hypothetical protein [Bacteroidales bacterium]